MWISKKKYTDECRRLFRDGIQLGFETAMKRQALDKHNQDIINSMRNCKKCKPVEGENKKWQEMKKLLEC